MQFDLHRFLEQCSRNLWRSNNTCYFQVQQNNR